MKKLIFTLTMLMAAALVFGQSFDFGGGFGGGFGGMGGMSGSIPTPNAGSNKARDKANDFQDAMGGNIPMRFFNALNRNPIPNGDIFVPNLGSFKTNAEGKVILPPMRDGTYTLTFSLSGYITTEIEFTVKLGQVVFNWYNISPGMTNTDYRFVLEWGEKPADLDIHFVKTGGSGGYHISYMEMKRAEDGNAVLDRDDQGGYGPETITVGRIDNNATYELWVHDYTNLRNPNSDQMAKSGATLKIYNENRLVKTYRIPSTGSGLRWNVFTMRRGVITDVNTITTR